MKLLIFCQTNELIKLIIDDLIIILEDFYVGKDKNRSLESINFNKFILFFKPVYIDLGIESEIKNTFIFFANLIKKEINKEKYLEKVNDLLKLIDDLQFKGHKNDFKVFKCLVYDFKTEANEIKDLIIS